jgi:hypothetical protein
MFSDVKYGPVAPSSHFEIRVKPIQPEAGAGQTNCEAIGDFAVHVTASAKKPSLKCQKRLMRIVMKREKALRIQEKRAKSNLK